MERHTQQWQTELKTSFNCYTAPLMYVEEAQTLLMCRFRLILERNAALKRRKRTGLTQLRPYVTKETNRNVIFKETVLCG